jgi:hypothetical protein
MGAISGTQRVAFQTMTSIQRKMKGVKGWTKPMILNFIRVKVAKKIKEEKLQGARVVVDKALCVSPQQIREELKKGGVEEAKLPVVLPTSSAKHVSPLDNTLWHQLKERVRNRKPTTERGMVRVLLEEWNNITPEQLHRYYHHSGLTRRSDPTQGLE